LTSKKLEKLAVLKGFKMPCVPLHHTNNLIEFLLFRGIKQVETSRIVIMLSV